ncbi:hypothetical protein PFISCL1PPCAC_22063, partial [Pristionchus fissidentatus]
DNMLIVAVDTSIGGRTLCKPKFLEVLGITLNEFNDYVALVKMGHPYINHRTGAIGQHSDAISRGSIQHLSSCLQL